jgi:hypothetical protein
MATDHHNDWYDEECQIATERTIKAYTIIQQGSHTTTSMEDYWAVRNKRRKG